jgi:hypothetical protein
MYHNINAGRLRQYVELFTSSNEPDEYGQVGQTVLVFDAMAECKTVSGSKMEKYGTTFTSSIITVMMWYDERASNDQVLVWNDVSYTVTHINVDPLMKAMILTCEIVSKGTVKAVITPPDEPTLLTVTDGTVTEEITTAGDLVCTFTLVDEDTTGITVDFTDGTNMSGYYVIDGLNILLTSTGESALNIGTTMPNVQLTTSNGVSAVNVITTVLVNDPTYLTVNDGTITQGITVAGGVVCTFTASDEDNDLTFDFTSGENADDYYSISGFNVLLTSTGETFLNAGNSLPNVSITTNTGVTASNTITTVLVANTRYTPNLDGLTNYYQMSAGKTLTGDFIFSGYYYMDGSSFFAASKNTATGRFLYYKDTNTLYVTGSVGSAVITVPSDIFSVYKVYLIECTRVGNVITWRIDGVVVGTSTTTVGSVYIDSLASKWGNNSSVPYQKGRMRDITIGVTGNTEFFSLNNPFSDYPSGIYGSLGTQLTGYNFTASQILEVPIE